MTRGGLLRFGWAVAAALAVLWSNVPVRAGETSPAPADDVPRPGSIQYFGHWAVGCDNVLRCQAMTLEPPDASDAGTVMLEIVRTGGPAGEAVLRARGLDPLPSRLAL